MSENEQSFASETEEVFTDKVTLCEDGKYRWKYEYRLLRNPAIFLLIWKIFFFIVLGIFGFIFLLDIIDWGFDSENLLNILKFFGYFLIGMTALVVISYLIYVAMMGGKYVIEFVMDEKGVLHRQIEAQAEKMKKLGKATVIAGILTRKPSTIGAGIASQRTEMYSEFSKMRKVICRPMFELIKVNGLLDHNQVYARREDYEFVRDYILSHCENLKK